MKIIMECTTGEAEENARLIAAAPDLLAALMHLEHNARVSGAEMGLALEVANDAIAKAVGHNKGKEDDINWKNRNKR